MLRPSQRVSRSERVTTSASSSVPTAQVAMVRAAPAGDAGAAWQFVPDGQAAVPVFFLATTSFAYNADVEPDADHDGFGDETQDKCPTDASTQDSCPPPPPVAGPASAPDPAT